MESKQENAKSRRGYRAQDSVTSFTDATSTAGGDNRSDVFGDDKEANDSTEMKSIRTASTPTPLPPARLSNDFSSRRVSEDRRSAISQGRRSWSGDRRSSIGGMSNYEDASTDAGEVDDDDDARSTRSIYEDAPPAEDPPSSAVHVGSRGYLRRKPVQEY